jgi:hypothetical protein
MGTAFLQIVTSAAAVQYARKLGGTGLHIGLLNALPTGMLFMQLLAGMAASRLTYRRPLWFWLSVIQRTLMVPVALGPLLFPQIADSTWIWVFLGANVALHGLAQFGHPLWMSWMGDYLPREGLSSYWGQRQVWMNWTIVASLMASAMYVFWSGLTIRQSFPHLCVLAAVLGVVDLLFFLRVEEPPIVRMKKAAWRDVLVEPFRHQGFRSFIGYACTWHFAAMIGAPFISLYLLQHIGMSLFEVLMLWAISATGGALSAGYMGRFAERCGNKPLLVFCTLFKPINMLSLILCPRDPQLAFWVLIPAFMFDAALNVGISIGQDGFLLKQSPARNRAMFMASGMAMAGLVGCATSIICGALLTSMRGWSMDIIGFQMNGFHILFWASAVMRFATLRSVCRIEEPAAVDHRLLAITLIRRTTRRTLRLRAKTNRPVVAARLAAVTPTDRAA